jgi:hypothetical protein
MKIPHIRGLCRRKRTESHRLCLDLVVRSEAAAGGIGTNSLCVCVGGGGRWFGPGLNIPPQNEPWFVKLTFCCDFQIQTNLCKFLPDRVNKKIYTCRGEIRVLLGGSVRASGNKSRFYLLY